VIVISIVIVRWSVLFLLCAESLSGQSIRLGAHGVALLTHADPMLNGSSMTEGYLTQPMLLADAEAWRGTVRAHVSMSLEPLTLKRGELGAGSYGEGYVDRRHPHTYAHELMVSAQHAFGAVETSVAAGRGFTPFGTDDPMMRPFVKYPVNHHLGQILERIVAIVGVRGGPVLVEAALFGGNEPRATDDWGSLDRFGDSWTARLTLLPVAGVEVQGSRAWVESPELPEGGGWDQRKWSASARYERLHGAGTVYALAEWKRTTEVSLDRDLFSFGSVLIEAALDRNGWRPAVRLERSERPEEERLFDPFRAPWPHGDAHVLGITRWTIVAARLERSTTWRALRVAPFMEASVAHVTATTGGLFEPEAFYGGSYIRTLNIGARIGVGEHRTRMGRYGVAGAMAHAHAH
jgi:hypothetical protein